jgi:hypothetical protein
VAIASLKLLATKNRPCGRGKLEIRNETKLCKNSLKEQCPNVLGQKGVAAAWEG